MMEIGWELFANVEELALFVLPGAGGAVDRVMVPDMALIIAAKDPARSADLWNQLLTLPAVLGLPQVPPAAETEIGGRAAREYRFPEVPPLVVVQLDGRGVALGTRTAVAAAARACAGNDRLADDPAFGKLIERLPPNAAKAVLVDVARAVDVAASVSDGRDADELKMISALIAPLRFVAATDEGPASFAVRVEASGLPDISRIVRTLAENDGDLMPASRRSAARVATPAADVAEPAAAQQATDVGRRPAARSDE
jgi:hypothetical protein